MDEQELALHPKEIKKSAEKSSFRMPANIRKLVFYYFRPPSSSSLQTSQKKDDGYDLGFDVEDEAEENELFPEEEKEEDSNDKIKEEKKKKHHKPEENNENNDEEKIMNDSNNEDESPKVVIEDEEAEEQKFQQELDQVEEQIETEETKNEEEEEEENKPVVTTTSLLQQVKCIPHDCHIPKHYIASPNALTDKRGYMYVASFPGSGNTWTRSVIEEGTRVFTGSLYADDTLKKEGFEAENINPWRCDFPCVSAIKIHYPYFRTPKPSRRVHGVIQVLRSPFDALLSEYSREHGEGRDPHTSFVPVEKLQKDFPEWFGKRSRLWLGFMKFWMGSYYWWPNNTAVHRESSNGITSFTLNRGIFGASTNRTVPIVVLFYEDFIRNFEESSRRMFGFMKERLGGTVPSIENSVICAVRNHQEELVSHRHNKHKDYNTYHDKKGLGATQMVQRFCQNAEPYWYEEMWGPCESAVAQSLRGIPIVAPPQLPHVKCTAPPT